MPAAGVLSVWRALAGEFRKTRLGGSRNGAVPGLPEPPGAVSIERLKPALNRALESGAIKKNGAADADTAEIVYWEPITPHITKDDFER